MGALLEVILPVFLVIGAGFAGLVAAKAQNVLGLTTSSRILLYLSEGPVDA